MRKFFVLFFILLTACAPSEESIQQAIAETQSVWTAVPTQSPYPTYTAPPPVIETKLVIVTATLPPTPRFTPTETRTPPPTTDITKSPKRDGFYLVGSEIAPGVWRSTAGRDSCYWSVTEADGDIISNHFGASGGTAYIPANGFQVEFNDCGLWEYLSPP